MSEKRRIGRRERKSVRVRKEEGRMDMLEWKKMIKEH